MPSPITVAIEIILIQFIVIHSNIEKNMNLSFNTSLTANISYKMIIKLQTSRGYETMKVK